MTVQIGFQRVKVEGGDYTTEEKQNCKLILDEIGEKYPVGSGSKRR